LPKNTSQEVLDWYQKYFVEAVNSKETKEAYEKQYIFIDKKTQTPAGVRADMYRLREQWQPIVKKISSE